MERFTISLDDKLASQFSSYIEKKGYNNRSEAVRDIIRDVLETGRKEFTGVDCIGTLTYMYDHHERELARRLTQEHHNHHDLSISTLHVHLDHSNCMETVVVRGKISEIQHFADHIIAEPGVRHGHLYLIPADVELDSHSHGDTGLGPKHNHIHIHPKS